MDELLKDHILSKPHEGNCALCGNRTKMTFEHIPPKSAFNNTRAKPVSFANILKGQKKYPWDVSGMKYTHQQSGMGVYSLCDSCNNNTGTWYGNAYCDFADKAMNFVNSDVSSDYHSVQFDEIYPLRFIKQVFSMFCSINPEANIDDLRRFVLGKEATGLDKSKYRLCMYFTRCTTRKYFGLTAITDIKRRTSVVMSEIIARPFGFILYFDHDGKMPIEGFDITSFADCKYDELANITMPIEFREVNNWMPYDFRSRDEIKKAIDRTSNGGSVDNQ